jgi:putative PIN family toxin of toxin-antitoxin system
VKVVFDTNIYISAFVVPKSQAEKAILKVIENDDLLIISKEIIDEALTVLAAKFSRDREAISRTAIYLSDIASLVKTRKRIKVFKDEPDNRILECAISGNADVIVTGDKEMLKLGEYEGIRIISLKEYLEG